MRSAEMKLKKNNTKMASLMCVETWIFIFSPKILYTQYNNYFRVQDIIHGRPTSTRAHNIIVKQWAALLRTFYMWGKHRSLSYLLNNRLSLFSIKYIYFSVSTHLSLIDENASATYLMFIVIMTKPLRTCIIHNFVSQ